ncbi:DUF5658 family protein [Clostridium paraputrificum]|uniref:DUF5658 family protein n=1 Tax=Clostridium TaxID=1485 RepID=UPI003D325480
MFSFIKEYDLKSIKQKLQILFFLNVIDIVLTIILLDTGLFEEANIFMRYIVNNTFLSIIIKVGLVALLLIALYYRIQTATINQLKISNKIIVSSIAIYAFINLTHVIWSFLAIISLVTNK